jgi:ATP-binding cassette subfamily F protein 3
LQAEKVQLDERLADPALYADADREILAGLLKRQAELAGLIEATEMRWLEVHEALEALPAPA